MIIRHNIKSVEVVGRNGGMESYSDKSNEKVRMVEWDRAASMLDIYTEDRTYSHRFERIKNVKIELDDGSLTLEPRQRGY